MANAMPTISKGHRKAIQLTYQRNMKIFLESNEVKFLNLINSFIEDMVVNFHNLPDEYSKILMKVKQYRTPHCTIHCMKPYE